MPQSDDDEIFVEDAMPLLGLTTPEAVTFLIREGKLAARKVKPGKITSPWIMKRGAVLALKRERDAADAAAAAKKVKQIKKRAQPTKG